MDHRTAHLMVGHGHVQLDMSPPPLHDGMGLTICPVHHEPVLRLDRTVPVVDIIHHRTVRYTDEEHISSGPVYPR